MGGGAEPILTKGSLTHKVHKYREYRTTVYDPTRLRLRGWGSSDDWRKSLELYQLCALRVSFQSLSYTSAPFFRSMSFHTSTCTPQFLHLSAPYTLHPTPSAPPPPSLFKYSQPNYCTLFNISRLSSHTRVTLPSFPLLQASFYPFSSHYVVALKNKMIVLNLATLSLHGSMPGC
jgi:hypothetical protein